MFLRHRGTRRVEFATPRAQVLLRHVGKPTPRGFPPGRDARTDAGAPRRRRAWRRWRGGPRICDRAVEHQRTDKHYHRRRHARTAARLCDDGMAVGHGAGAAVRRRDQLWPAPRQAVRSAHGPPAAELLRHDEPGDALGRMVL